MADVFISYKQDERERMRPIAEGLRSLGVDVWFDERLAPDKPFTEEIQQVMSTCRAQIVCWSEAAVKSEWVRGEADVGRQRGVLVSLMIEPCVLPPPFNMYHAENLDGWTGEPTHAGWRKILTAVGDKVGRPGLSERAALIGSDSAEAWKRWASKYPDDPLADEAWKKAEALHMEGERARFAADRESAHARAANQPHASAPPVPPPASVRPARRRNALVWAVPLILIIGALGVGGAWYSGWRPSIGSASKAPTTATPSPPAVSPEAVRADLERELVRPGEHRLSRSALHLQIARTYLFPLHAAEERVNEYIDLDQASRDHVSEAKAAIVAALQSDNSGGARPRVMLAQILMWQRDWAGADRELQILRNDRLTLTDDIRAFVLFLSSRREIFAHQVSLGSEVASLSPSMGRNAVAWAMQAFELVRTARYRRQACLAGIHYGIMPDRSYCMAERGRDENYSEALLFEGMYLLRVAYTQTGGNQRNTWGWALRTFEQGLAEARPTDTVASMDLIAPGEVNLQALHQYGRLWATYCAGLGGVDHEAVNPEMREYFRRMMGIDRCWSRPASASEQR